jgi:hypothetical protein
MDSQNNKNLTLKKKGFAEAPNTGLWRKAKEEKQIRNLPSKLSAIAFVHFHARILTLFLEGIIFYVFFF